MKMAKKFPQTIFVKYEDGGSDPEYLAASDDVIGMVDVGDKTRVGIYRLESTVECEGIVKTTAVPKRR